MKNFHIKSNHSIFTHVKMILPNNIVICFICVNLSYVNPIFVPRVKDKWPLGILKSSKFNGYKLLVTKSRGE